MPRRGKSMRASGSCNVARGMAGGHRARRKGGVHVMNGGRSKTRPILTREKTPSKVAALLGICILTGCNHVLPTPRTWTQVEHKDANVSFLFHGHSLPDHLQPLRFHANGHELCPPQEFRSSLRKRWHILQVHVPYGECTLSVEDAKGAVVARMKITTGEEMTFVHIHNRHDELKLSVGPGPHYM